jgi:AAA family ATP:ADP antiporter
LDGGRLYRILRRFSDIRPGESRAAASLFVYFFLITFSIYIIKAVEETFLIGINPRLWPYPDLITVGLIGFVTAFNTRLLNKLSRRVHASRTALFFASNLVVFWLIFDMNARNMVLSPTVDASGLLGAVPLLVSIKDSWPAPVIAFSFWTDIFIVMSVTHFWIAVNDVFNLHQAKRTIGFLVTGGLLGGIAGALLTWLLGRVVGPTNLLLICPAVLVVMLVVIKLVYGQARKAPESPDAARARAGPRLGYLESLRTVRKDSYLRLLAALLFAATAVGVLINYQFKSIVKDLIGNDVLRTSFLGSFFFWILVVSAAVHLATTSRLLKTFGIRLALLVAPVVLILGTASFFILPAAGLMVWACFMRGSDKTFDNTISQSVRELLYIPVPASVKYKAKVFIDMFVNKFAVGFGAALYWVLYRALSFGYKDPVTQVREVAYFVIALAALWIALAGFIYARYVGVLKNDLKRLWQEAHKKLEANVDVESLGLIVDLLQSREKSSTLYLMNLFRIVRKEKLTPELREALAFKEDELMARSMDSLLDVSAEAPFREIEETVPDRDIAQVISEVLRLDTFKEVMHAKLAEIAGQEAAPEVSRMEAALLTGLMEPTPEVLRSLEDLLHDPSPEVLNYALGSAAVHRHASHVPSIIRLLGNPTTRRAAQTALAAYGREIDDVLRRHLQDEAESPDVRRAIPEVLARTGGQAAADILTGELSRGKGEMEQEIIDALFRIRADQPGILFKKKRVRAAVLSLVKRSYDLFLEEAGAGEGRDPAAAASDPTALLDLLVKRIFDLLTLVSAPDDIAKAYQNILKGTGKSVDSSLELLDNILDRTLKTYFFPLVDDMPREQKVRLLRKLRRRLDRASSRSRLKWPRGSFRMKPKDGDG